MAGRDISTPAAQPVPSVTPALDERVREERELEGIQPLFQHVAGGFGGEHARARAPAHAELAAVRRARGRAERQVEADRLAPVRADDLARRAGREGEVRRHRAAEVDPQRRQVAGAAARLGEQVHLAVLPAAHQGGGARPHRRHPRLAAPEHGVFAGEEQLSRCGEGALHVRDGL